LPDQQTFIAHDCGEKNPKDFTKTEQLDNSTNEFNTNNEKATPVPQTKEKTIAKDLNTTKVGNLDLKITGFPKNFNSVCNTYSNAELCEMFLSQD